MNRKLYWILFHSIYFRIQSDVCSVKLIYVTWHPPCLKTLTNSPRWYNPTSCNLCLSSSVVAALEENKQKPYKSFSVYYFFEQYACQNLFENSFSIPRGNTWTQIIPIFLTSEQIKWVFGSKERIVIQNFYGWHPVRIEILGYLLTRTEY